MPWSDPGGGKNQNPWGRRPTPKPALDYKKITLWLQRASGRLFGKGGQGGPNTQDVLVRLPFFVAGAAVLVWIASGLYVVGPGEEGVVLRFGKEVAVVSPGLHYHLPYPVETVYRLKITRSPLVVGYTGEVGEGTSPGMMLTADGNVVDVRFSVQYRISNVRQYLFNAADPEQVVRDVAVSAMREVVGRTGIGAIMAEGQGAMAEKAQQIMQQALDRYRVGIKVDSVQILQARLPKAVEPAFLSVTAAREDMARARSEAQAYADNIIPRARGEAARMIAEAQAYHQQIVDRAKGDSARFLELLKVYEQDPKVVGQNLYLQTMEEILHRVPKVIVDSKRHQVIFLPVGQLPHAAAATAPTASPAQSAPRAEASVPPAAAPTASVASSAGSAGVRP